MIHSLATRAPSQTCCPSLWSAACQGQSPWRAGRAREEEEEEEGSSSMEEEEERSSPEAETAMKPGSLEKVEEKLDYKHFWGILRQNCCFMLANSHLFC